MLLDQVKTFPLDNENSFHYTEYVFCVFYKSLYVKLYSSSTSVRVTEKGMRGLGGEKQRDEEERMISGRQTQLLIELYQIDSLR